MKNIFCYISFYLLFVSCTSYEISFADLLGEMTSREMLAKYPDPYYITKQFSSYDQSSVHKDTSSWYANWDRSQFLRTETNYGRREFVLFDAEGPGAVVRFWVTVADYTDKGVIRFYLDGSDTPVIEGEVLHIIGGGGLVGAPLSASVSELTEYKQRGHNLYLPIPYGKSCKITYESPSIKEPGEHSGECFYYNINYRTYNKNVTVKTFTEQDLESNYALIEEVQKRLEHSEVSTLGLTQYVGNTKILKSGEESTIALSGMAAIKKLEVRLNAVDLSQALRSTVLKISFDGKENVWVPVGDFFGTGNRLSPYQTYFTHVSADTLFSCYWVMPYKQTCEISLLNVGEEDVSSSLTAYISDWHWNKNSMYFGAGWTEYHKLYTGKTRDMAGTNAQFDINFVKLTGKGVYIGDAVTLFNPVADWWGEGDEKIYIDGEEFPSHFGTGTEDYYGYAWCMHNFFDHPFIAEPDGEGSTQPGHVVNVRYRALDAVPFEKSLIFDMEVWHWASTLMNYAPVTYWYMLPGGESNRIAEPELAANTIAKHKNDLVSNYPDESSIIEGEFMNIALTGGEEKSQSLAFMPWSNGAQFFWKDAQLGEEASLGFRIKEAGTYQVKAHLTFAPDYGTFRIYINNQLVNNSFSFYRDSLITELIDLGKYNLNKGDNRILFIQQSPDKHALNNFLGVDYLKVIKY